MDSRKSMFICKILLLCELDFSWLSDPLLLLVYICLWMYLLLPFLAINWSLSCTWTWPSPRNLGEFLNKTCWVGVYPIELDLIPFRFSGVQRECFISTFFRLTVFPPHNVRFYGLSLKAPHQPVWLSLSEFPLDASFPLGNPLLISFETPSVRRAFPLSNPMVLLAVIFLLSSKRIHKRQMPSASLRLILPELCLLLHFFTPWGREQSSSTVCSHLFTSPN